MGSRQRALMVGWWDGCMTRGVGPHDHAMGVRPIEWGIYKSNVFGPQKVFTTIPIFWPSLEFRVYDIWEEFTRECCQNELDRGWLRCSSVVHLDMEG